MNKEEQNGGFNAVNNDIEGEKTSKFNNDLINSIGFDEIYSFVYLDYLAELDFPNRFFYAVKNTPIMSGKKDEDVKTECLSLFTKFYRSIKVAKPNHNKLQSEIKNLNNWLSGKFNPLYKNRGLVYKLCYILGLDDSETRDFFKRGCLFGAFDPKQSIDAVYFFFLRNIPSKKRLADEDPDTFISQLKKTTIRNKSGSDTDYLRSRLEEINNKDTLKEYIASNCGLKRNFKAALDWIENLQNECKKLYSFDELINSKKLSNDFKNELVGIESAKLMKEPIYSIVDELPQTVKVKLNGELKKINMNVFDKIYKHNIRKNSKYTDFNYGLEVLGDMIDSGTSEEDKARIIAALKYVNKSLPRYVENLNDQDSDFIRRTLIVLFFADWFKSFYNKGESKTSKADIEKRYIEFYNRLREILSIYGFFQIYPCNPFDWIIMKCATCEDPILALQEVIKHIYGCDFYDDREPDNDDDTDSDHA